MDLPLSPRDIVPFVNWPFEWAIHGFPVLLTTWWHCVRLSFCFRMNVENGDAHIRAKQTQQMDTMAPTCAQTIKNHTQIHTTIRGPFTV